LSESKFSRATMLALSKTPLGRFVSDLPVRYFDATIEGTEHVPARGGALLVGNHAFMGLDGVVLAPLLLESTGRYPRFLGDRMLFRVEPFRSMFQAVGAIEGEPEAAVSLLESGDIVVVYPGGAEDSFKLSSEKHRLQWGARKGFAKVAMRAKVPIIPVCALGIDDMFTILGREKWLGRRLFGSVRYDIPIAFGRFGLPIPRRRPQRFIVLPPIETEGDPENPDDVERVRAATFDALEKVLSEAR
jgi:1-acyl-sn-glycerol-3-phosphate acyltransferase